MRDVQILASFVHGAMFFGHTLGFIFHASKGKWGHATIHAGAAIYDGISVLRHTETLVERLREEGL
jgi:hypothetical protein